MMQGSVGIPALFLLTELYDAHVIALAFCTHTNTHTHSSAVLVKMRENEQDSCSFACLPWKCIKENGSGSFCLHGGL